MKEDVIDVFGLCIDCRGDATTQDEFRLHDVVHFSHRKTGELIMRDALRQVRALSISVGILP